MRGDRVAVLLQRVDLGAEAHVAVELPVEGQRKLVHASLKLLHVLEGPPDDLAELLDDGGVQVGLAEAHDAVQLDRAFGEAAIPEEGADRVAVVGGRQPFQAVLTVLLVHVADLLGGGMPQVLVGPAALVGGQFEVEALGVAVDLVHGHALPADIGKRFGIAHNERT